ncbi:MAG TPA: di-heme-cytochrome C peroxidase, partial [Alphaproteobacteria bacterium]|nr:di-heme-cytochrome C peroxidase [Alphaproteobacteria bacterium]
DAPVSYPFIWDIPQQDYVQWNGLAPNAGLSSLGRNTGEVIGVFATLDWSEKPGFSLSSLISGQGIHATHISFESSVNVHNLKGIEHQLWSLHSPKWPSDILGPINEERRAKGEILFKQYCVSCHTEIDRDDPNRRGVAHLSRLNEVGTDPQMAANATNGTGLSGVLKNQYVNTGGGQVLIDKRAPVADLLTKATISVIATPRPDKSYITRGLDWADDLIAAYFTNEIKPSIKRGSYDPDTTSSPYSSLLSYKARSLNGIWATAPYLHNGSVPTLYDLLLPPKGPKDPEKGEYRPDEFQVGSREFDPQKVGFKSSGYTGFTFNTRRRGNLNTGHLYGTKVLSTDDRWALVEYLKSL